MPGLDDLEESELEAIAAGDYSKLSIPTLERVVEFEKSELSKEPGLAGAAARGLGKGYATFGKGLGGIIRWVGDEESGKRIYDFWDKREREWSPPERLQADVMERPGLLLDPKWWAYNAPTVIGTAIPFFVPGAAGGMAAYRLAQGSRLFAPVAARVAQMGGTAAATASNALFEGGLAYGAAKEAGADDEKAGEVAARVARRNAVWTASVAGPTVFFNPFLKSVISKLALNSVMEGVQEVGEEFISGEALYAEDLGPKPTLSGTSFVLGAVGGGAMGAGFDAISGQEANQTAAIGRAAIKQEVARLAVERGIPEERAAQMAEIAVERVFAEPVSEEPDEFTEMALSQTEPEQRPAPEAGPLAAEAAQADVPPVEEVSPLVDVVHPETGKKVYEMTWQEFVGQASDESGGEISAAEAADVHRGIVEAAKEAGRDVPAEIEESIDETEPEIAPENITFEFGENVPEAEGGRPKTIAEMTRAEFQERFPGAPPDIHREQIRQAIRQVKPVHDKALEEYQDIREEVEDQEAELIDAERREHLRRYSPVPILDELRRVGLNLEAFEKGGYIGDAENLKGRGVFRKKGGLTPDQAAEHFGAAKLISEADIHELLERAGDEVRKGRKADLMREGGGRRRELIIQHNITGEKILHAKRVGGLAVPSLAITKVGHPIHGFGDITLLGDSSLADPRSESGARVYGADIYSPRYPRINYKPDPKLFDALEKKLAPFADSVGGSKYLDRDSLEVQGADYLFGLNSVRAMFLKERGVSWKVPEGEVGEVGDWKFTEALRDAIRENGLDDELRDFSVKILVDMNPTERIFTGYTPSANRRYKPHTLGNVVAILKKNLRGGESFNYGIGSLRAEFTPRFKSLKTIRMEAGRLIGKEEFDAVKKEMTDEFFSIADDLEQYYSHERGMHFSDTVMAVMADARKRGMAGALKEYGFSDVPEDIQKRIGEYLNKLRLMPTEYFEAKLPRAASLSEFKAAVVPEGTSREVLDELESHGLEIRTYKEGDAADRSRVIKETAAAGPGMIFERGLTPEGNYPEISEPAATPEAEPPAASLSEPGKPDGEISVSSSGKSVAEKPEDFKGPSQEEQQIAFDFKGEISQYVSRVADEIEKSIRKSFPNHKAILKALESLKQKGSLDYIGRAVRGPADVAEIAAIWRHPAIEHFGVIFTRGGVVVDHWVITSIVSDLVALPDKFKSEVLEFMRANGIDGWYVHHNHPSGNPTPSDVDIATTARLADQFGAEKFGGHVVTDDVEYSIIDKDGKHATDKFIEAKESYRPEKTAATTPTKAVEIISSELKDKSKIGALFVDPDGHILGFEQIPPGADVLARVEASLKYFHASGFFLAADSGIAIELARKKYRGRLVDLLSFQKDGSAISYRESFYGQYQRMLGEIETPAVTERVQEPGPKYEVEPVPPAIPEQFAEMVKRKKIGPGTRVTVSSRFVDPGIGPVPRGRKGRIIAVDLKGGTLLVDFSGKIAIVNPNRLAETSVLPKPDKPIPAKKQIAISTGIEQPETVHLTEQEALRVKLASEARGAKYGARQAARETKAKITEEFRAKLMALEEKWRGKAADVETMLKAAADIVESTKKEILGYLRENLPQSAWGKFVPMVLNAKTARDAYKALWRINLEAEAIYKKSLMDDIRKRLARTLDSPSIAIEYRRRIAEVISGIEVEGHRQSTLDRLRKTQDFLDRMKEKGEDIDVPQEVLDQLAILARRPIRDMSEAELEGVSESLELLERLGKTMKRSREEIWKAKRDRLMSELQLGTKPIEKHKKIARRPGDILGTEAKLRNMIAKARDFFQNLDIAITPMDVVFDLLDDSVGYIGANYRIFKKTLDRAFSAYLDQKYQWIDPVRQLADKLGLNDSNFERIGVHAVRAQKGGMEKLLAMGLTQEEIDAYKLTDAEMELYRKMREIIEKPYNDVRRLLAELYNRDIGKVENYFPFHTDWEAMSDIDVFTRLGDTMSSLGHRSKTVEQGSTKARVGGKLAVRINAMEVFEHHMDDVAYFLQMQRDIKMLDEIANSSEYQAAAGEVGGFVVSQWLDLMSKKGGVEGAKRIAGFDMLRRNIGAAVLGFKLSSIVVQPTSLIDASFFVGGEWISQGLRDAVFSPEWRKFLVDNIPELRYRTGDDTSFNELSGLKNIQELQRLGFYALESVDKFTAIATAAGAYRKALAQSGIAVDLNKPNREALEAAALALRRSQSSPYFKDLGIALTRGALPWIDNRSVAKMLLQFKAFMLNRWSLKHDMARLGWKGGNKSELAWAAMYLTMANAAEMGLRSGTKTLLAAILGGFGLAAKKAIDDEDDDLAKDFASQVLGNVPFVSEAVNGARYHRTSIPAVDSVLAIGTGAYAAAAAVKTRTRLRGIVESLSGIATVFGIPGTAQFAQISRIMLKDGSVVYPHNDEIRDLKDKEKKGYLLDDERPRLARLKASRSRFVGFNQRYKKAMERGDLETAEKMAKKMREEVERFK